MNEWVFPIQSISPKWNAVIIIKITSAIIGKKYHTNAYAKMLARYFTKNIFCPFSEGCKCWSMYKSKAPWGTPNRIKIKIKKEIWVLIENWQMVSIINNINANNNKYPLNFICIIIIKKMGQENSCPKLKNQLD